MLGFDEPGFDIADTNGEPENHWDNHMSLPRIIQDKLPPPPQVELDRMFSPFFNFMDMKRLGDFDIKPTKNLMNHLYVAKFRNREPKTTVFVFHHARILERLCAPLVQYSLLEAVNISDN